MPKITLTNDFHHTTIAVRTRAGMLNSSQVRRVRKALCGIAHCQCDFEIGARGPDNPRIEYNTVTGCARIYPDEG